MTIVELMVGTALLVGGGGAMLMGMQYTRIHGNYLNDFRLAMNAVQGRIEELSSKEFSALLTSPAYAAARTDAGQCTGLAEDMNCDGVLNGAEDTNGNGALDEPLPGARMHVRVVPFPPGAADPSLLTLHASACWRWRGRVMSEDANCNGAMENGEDVNGNGWLDSPAMLTTRVSNDAQ
jgi:hypothetical protein